MLIMLSLIVLSLLVSGVCITDKRIAELLIKPIYTTKDIKEIEVPEEISDDDIANLTDLDDSKDTEVSEQQSVSVQDILNK